MRKMVLCVMVLLIMTALPVSASAKVSEDSVGEDEVVRATDMLAQEMRAKCITLDRRNIVDDIYEYTFTFKVGEGKFDKIGVHRVVKERKPWKPVRTDAGVMTTPGDWMGFRAMYLLSTETDAPGIDINHSLAIYLAENNIDVWGIDLRRSFVPDHYPGTDVPYCSADPDNCTFMKDWNMETQLSDIKCATKFARMVRLFTRQGHGKVFMLGASRGGRLTYAYANAETQIKPWERDLKGIITMDVAYKFDPDAEVFYCGDYTDPSTCNSISASEAACGRYQILKSLYESGTYYNDETISLKTIAYLADTFPDLPSPIIDGFTNREVGELTLSATYLLVKPPMTPRTSFYHYCAGTFEAGHPTGLNFTNYDYMIDLAYSLVSFQSIGYMMDDEAIMCNDSSVVDVPYDDHLGEITIPVLYVGAEDGYGGYYGNYTTTLLGSTDVAIHIVPGYAHIDGLYANDAESMAWKLIYDWLESH